MTGGHVAPRFRAGSEWLQQRRSVSQFGYPPSLSAFRGELSGDGDERGHDAGRLQPHAGIAARQQQGGRRIAEKVCARIRGESRDVGAAVVDAEHEPARQLRQCGLGLNRLVQFGDQSADVGCPFDAAGQRRRDDIAHALMSLRGQQASRGDDFGDRRGVGDGPQLDVAARREFHGGRSEPRRSVSKCLQLSGRDHAAR